MVFARLRLAARNLRQPRVDRRVVARGALERLAREPRADRVVEPTARAQLGEHLGTAGQALDVQGVEPRIAQRLRGAARAHQLDAEVAQPARELDQPAFVGYRQQRPQYFWSSLAFGSLRATCGARRAVRGIHG